MYIQLNGQILSYEKEGEGSPIIFLHGNGETHAIWDRMIAEMSMDHTVYAIDSRGQGESATPKEYHYKDMAATSSALSSPYILKSRSCAALVTAPSSHCS